MFVKIFLLTGILISIWYYRRGYIKYAILACAAYRCMIDAQKSAWNLYRSRLQEYVVDEWRRLS